MGVRIPPRLPALARGLGRESEQRIGDQEESRGSMEFLGRVQQFFREVAAEFRRVNWPSRAEVVNSTAVVLAVVVILAVFLAAVDVGLSWVVDRVLRWG